MCVAAVSVFSVPGVREGIIYRPSLLVGPTLRRSVNKELDFLALIFPGPEQLHIPEADEKVSEWCVGF